MAHRVVCDERGVWWEVWDVRPARAERRREPHEHRREHRGSDGRSNVGMTSAGLVERRHRTEVRYRLPAGHEEGWLAFRCRDERRRLAPCPGNWESLGEDALLELLARATPSTPVTRLVE